MAFESSEISIEPATGVSVCECFQDLGHCKNDHESVFHIAGGSQGTID